jgi:hypothetical protein
MIFRSKSSTSGKTQESSTTTNGQGNGKKSDKTTSLHTTPLEEESFTIPQVSATPTQTIPPPNRELLMRKPLSRPTTVPDNPSKRKRASRPDPYDVPSSPEATGSEIEESQEKPNKRIKASVKAKQPLMQPKKSNGNGSTTAPPRQIRSKMTTVEPVAVPSTEAPITNGRDIIANRNEDQSHPTKARRGRPRKQKPEAVVVVVNHDSPEMPIPSEEPVNDAGDSETGAERLAELSNIVSRLGVSRVPPDEDEDNVASILMNPSPKKVIPTRPREIFRNSTTKRKGRAEASDGARVGGNRDNINMSLREDESDMDEEDVVDTNIVGRKFQHRTEPSGSQHNMIKPEVLEEMLAKIRQVGHTYNDDRKTWVRKKEAGNLKSVGGKRLDRRLKVLIMAYDTIFALKAARKANKIKKAQEGVPALVDAIIEEAGKISNSLGHPADSTAKFGENSTSRILQDLYFHLMPHLVLALKSGVRAHTFEGNVGTDAIEELVNLLEVICDLAEAARRQPKGAQPRAPQSNKHHISQPTRHLLPMARKLHEELLVELERGKREPELAEMARVARESAAERREEEERMLAEKRRRNREIIKQQKEDWAAKEADPTWGRLLKAQVAAEDAKSAARRAEMEEDLTHRVQGTTETQGHEESDDEGMEDDPFGDEGLERVSVFGKNNSQNVSSPRPWSNDEKAVFIDVMRYWHGNWLLTICGQSEN